MPTPLSIIKRLLASTCVLIVLSLVAFDYFIDTVKPLRFVNATGFTPFDQDPLVAKIPEFLASSKDPDILVLGSSLSVYPAVRVDDMMLKGKTRFDKWYARNHINSYTKAEYFKKHLSERLNQEISLHNLGVIACLLSDQYLTFKKVLATGKRPRLVICQIAPRDFMDNHRQVVEQTPVYHVLAGLDCFSDMLTQNRSMDQIRNFLISQSWGYYRTKADYKTFISAYTADLLNRPVDSYEASKYQKDPEKYLADKAYAKEQQKKLSQVLSQKPDYTAPPNTLEDLDIYEATYNPPNLKVFKDQSNCLEKMMKLSKKTGVPVLFVNMPLTPENKQIMKPFMNAKYQNLMKTMSAKYSTVTYIDLDTPDYYQLSEFRDSCHLNASGGKKFYNALIDSVASRKELKQAVCSKNSNGFSL